MMEYSNLVSSISSIDSKKQIAQKLERGWCDKVSIIPTPKREIRLNNECRNLLLKSMPSLGLPAITINKKTNKPLHNDQILKTVQDAISNNDRNQSREKLKSSGKQNNAFSSIASTFGFNHHEGSDRNIELKVIKHILLRESILLKLIHLCERTGNQVSLHSNFGTAVLDTIMQVREHTLNYLEWLVRWRTSIPDNDPTMPKVFYWEGDNYTLKIIRDLNFMANNVSLVDALGIPAIKLIANPLMLPNTLEDNTTWMDPVERAGFEANGQFYGEYFEERLRLRNAERILLLEIECNQINEGAVWDFQTSIVEENINKNVKEQSYIMTNNQSDDSFNEDLIGLSPHKEGLAAWQIAAQTQLANIKGLKGEVLSPKVVSTQRLNKVEKSLYTGAPGEPQYNYSNQWEAEPTKLTELDSSLLQRPVSRVRTTESKERRQEGKFIIPSMDPLEFLGLDSLDSTISFYEEFANAEEFSNLDGFNNNILPVDQMNGFFPNEIYEDDSLSRDSDYMRYRNDMKNFDDFSMFDIEVISGISNPSKELQVAAAIVIILASEEKSVPADLSWDFFKSLAGSTDLATMLNSFSPENTPAFKIRAVKPFLSRLDSQKVAEIQLQGGLSLSVTAAVMKLIKWCRFMVEIADKKYSTRTDILPSKDIKKNKVKKISIAPSSSSSPPSLKKEILQKTISNEDLKNTKKITKIPKLEPELCPIYSEILTEVYEHPILVTILTPVHEIRSSNNFKEWDPLNLLGGSDCDCTDRITLKAYDVVSSLEAVVVINVREYTLYLYEMRKKYGPDAVKYFRPASSQWWGVNAKKFVKILSRKKRLSVIIDKKSINQYLQSSLGIGIMNDTILTTNMEIVSPLPDTAKSTGNANANANPLPSADEWGFFDEDGNIDDQFVSVGDGISIFNDPFNDPLNAAPSKSKKESTLPPTVKKMTPKVQNQRNSNSNSNNNNNDNSNDKSKKANINLESKGSTNFQSERKTPLSSSKATPTSKKESKNLPVVESKGVSSRKNTSQEKKVTNNKNEIQAESKKSESKDILPQSKDDKDDKDSKQLPESLISSDFKEISELFNTDAKVLQEEQNNYADDFDDSDKKVIVNDYADDFDDGDKKVIVDDYADDFDDSNKKVSQKETEEVNYDVDFEDPINEEKVNSITNEDDNSGTEVSSKFIEEVVDNTQLNSIVEDEIIDNSDVIGSIPDNTANKNNDTNYDEDFEA